LGVLVFFAAAIAASLSSSASSTFVIIIVEIAPCEKVNVQRCHKKTFYYFAAR
jgi:hypothetical protein